MPDASPAKWHLGHTTWFFEAMLLRPHAAAYRVFDPAFHYLFNSYYEALGPRQPRPRRGMLSRPGLDVVLAYRQHVDDAMQAWMSGLDADAWSAVLPTIVLGLQHEQQHQELILTDILHALSCNPLLPAYRGEAPEGDARRKGAAEQAWSDGLLPGNSDVEMQPRAPSWLERGGAMAEAGHDGNGFAFDNETPRHPVWLQPYAMADRLVSCGEYLAFMEDGGYSRPELWLSEGWATVQSEAWKAPIYWLHRDDPRLAGRPLASAWQVFGLQGVQPLNPDAPVSNLSFYEACAYAEWARARLPTEFEWEDCCEKEGLPQAFGHVWQWTRSAYAPYPGFRPLAGPAAEYNGKFMVGQQVLRGSSIATPDSHSRITYRNFFPPAARWQFTGLRLARDL
jgi:ergothioneine biosynthesis protein EgtB